MSIEEFPLVEWQFWLTLAEIELGQTYMSPPIPSIRILAHF